MATRAAYSDMFRTSMSDGLAAGTCFAWLCEIVIVESSWLTTTEYSLASQGSSRVCETVRLSVDGEGGAISSRSVNASTNQKSTNSPQPLIVGYSSHPRACSALPELSLRRLVTSVMPRWGNRNLLTYNKSLDASGGSAFRNLLGAAKGALIR